MGTYSNIPMALMKKEFYYYFGLSEMVRVSLYSERAGAARAIFKVPHSLKGAFSGPLSPYI
jgi:hypothetical protein